MNNLKKYLLAMCMLTITMGMSATTYTKSQIRSYASSLKGLKKSALKTAVYNLCQPKTVLAYSAGSGHTWSGFYKTDRITSTNECRNRYSNDKYYFPDNYTSSYAAISGMNIEHSFPKSWWGGSTNNAYKDLFNLYPSASDANSSKSNYPMGKVTNASILDSYEKVGYGTAGSLGSIQLCEPNDTWKGDFCRSYFYMATIYQNLTWSGTQGLQELENDTWPTLREWAYTLYLEWTRNDRVTDIEVDRNNAVYDIQGNRNLFIDFPELAEYVWGDSIDVAFDPTTSLTSASDDSRFATYQAGTYEQGQSGGGETTTTASAPTLTAAATFSTDSYTVTITNNESGATVYYTTDGSTPTTSSTSFTGTSKSLTITATTTVKAMAVISGKNNSSVTSVTYTKTSSSSIANTAETAYTVAEASALIAAGNDLDTKVYVKGIISKIGDLNTKYGELTYYISDDGTTSNQLQIYDGYNLGKVKFTSTSEIEVGATVIVYGQLQSYYGTDEMNYGNYIVKYTAPGETEYDLTIGETGYATYYNSTKAYTMPSGVQGYTFNATEGKLVSAYAENVVVPADEALVLKGATGNYVLNFTTTTTSKKSDNALLGTDEETALTADDSYYFYALTLDKNSTAGSVGFYWMNETGAAFTNGAHKAYLKIAKTTSAKSAYVFADMDVSAISEIEAVTTENAPVYNIAGQRVNENTKGIIIKNGRKYINK